MKHRYIPFGYQMQDGVVQLHPNEALVVKRIFTAYMNGSSLITIAENLTKEKIEYFPNKYDWNRNRVKRILDDQRYLGDDTYPPIINEDIYEKVQVLKSDRNTQKNVDRENHASNITIPVVCPECGERLQRKHNCRNTEAELWKCTNAACNYKTKISDSELLLAITNMLNLIIDNPNIIEPDVSEGTSAPSLEVMRLTNEISRTLEGFDFDKEQLKNRIFECAAKKYSEIKSARHISDMLKTEFASQTRSSTFNKELLERTASKIILNKDGSVSLVLKNNQIIGKERIIHDPDSNCSATEICPYHTAQAGAVE